MFCKNLKTYPGSSALQSSRENSGELPPKHFVVALLLLYLVWFGAVSQAPEVDATQEIVSSVPKSENGYKRG